MDVRFVDQGILSAAIMAEAEPPQALVVGVWEGGVPSAPLLALGLEDWVAQVLRQMPAFTGKNGQARRVMLPRAFGDVPQVILVGLGVYGAFDAEAARRCGGEVGAVAQAAGCQRLAVDLGCDGAQAAWFALGVQLRGGLAWQVKGQPLAVEPVAGQPEGEPPEAERQPVAVQRLWVRANERRQAERQWETLREVALAVLWARRLVAMPANLLTPDQLEAEARSLEQIAARGEAAGQLSGQATGALTVETLLPDALVANGLRLLAAMGGGSAQAPRLLVVRWRPTGCTTPPVLLVGKGLTFDTGGLCVKPAAGMEEMKGDMGGAATVLGVMRAVAQAGLPLAVTGVLAVAENMPSGRAIRPGDVLTAVNGRTVEIIDTDAEGRLALADALAWGCATEAPRAVVDLATLTGSIVVALGRHHAGLFCTDDRLARRLVAAGNRLDEPFWRMPMALLEEPSPLDDDLKSDCADVRQCAPAGRLLPDALHAVRFLQHFVPPSLPWAHLDIAGVCDRDEPWAHMPKGPVGFGILTLCHWLGELVEQGEPTAG